MGEGQRDGVGAVLAPAVVLATGGLGQVFSLSTNPSVATGDGMALALRAGAVVADLEFVQFHPTVLWLGADATGQQPLVSEAVRGEGAVLRDDAGVRFMEGQHPLADLAPRDVVAKAIMRRMRETGAKHVWLDAREFGTEMWEARFPTILASLRQIGVDPSRDLIPVAPAQHYASGGVRTDVRGRSSVRGLYAVGECACTGVHGANRLASNSLLEGLVFASRIGDVLAEGLPERRDPVAADGARGGARRGRAASPAGGDDRGRRRAALARLDGGHARRARRGAQHDHRRPAHPCVGDDQPARGRHRARRERQDAQGDARARTGARTSPTPTTRTGTSGSPRTSTPTACSSPPRSRCRPRQPRRRSNRGARMTLQPHTLEALADAGLDPAYVEALVRATVAEDLDGGVDVTSAATVPADQRSTMDLVARGSGVAAGVPVAAAVFDAVSGGDAR